MPKNEYEDEFKGIKLLQDRSEHIQGTHTEIKNSIDDVKARLLKISQQQMGCDITQTNEYRNIKEQILQETTQKVALREVHIEEIYAEARNKYSQNITLNDILSIEDKKEVNYLINKHIEDFNLKYSLDIWDYAIAGSCGLFASMLDIMCVSAPMSPTTPYTQKVDGIFNQWVQEAFNKFLTPEISKQLSETNKIGSADVSTIKDILNAPDKLIKPTNHRLKALSHDPVLGLFFGVLDMMRGKITIASGGTITSYDTTILPVEGSILDNLSKMLGHLLSDVNAPSAAGNRGMGLPAPFMGLLRMFDNINIGDINIGKTVEYMYVKGYDFRQFVVTSIPVAIMEVLLRVFYIVKQMNVYNVNFQDAFVETVPLNLNPKFRIMLALSYGTFAGVNAGKVYVTKNILNANYAAWMGFAWNTFFALKWALLDRHLKLWGDLEKKQIAEIEDIIVKLDALQSRAEFLNIKTR